MERSLFAMGQMVDKYSNDFFRWGELYVSIRMANIVIARIGECTDITDFEDVTSWAVLTLSVLIAITL